MNILIVIANYHPIQNPNVLRWGPISEFWVQQGHQVTVLTTKHFDKPDTEEIKGVSIHRIGFATLKDWHYALIGREHNRSIPDPKSEVQSLETTSWKSRLSEKLVDLTWRKFYWPDGSFPFIRPAIMKGRTLLKAGSFDTVVSVGLPFSCHVIARTLRQEVPGIHWHMDIEDPFCYSDEFWVNNFGLYRNKNIKEEEKAFKSADSISVTNDGARKKYHSYFTQQMGKVSVIPPLYVEEDILETKLNKNGKTNLGYFGSFYSKVRSPKPLLEFLRYTKEKHPNWLEDKMFHFFGSPDRFSSTVFRAFKDLDAYFVFHGLVNRKEALGAMRTMDYLINFGNSTSYHLPSKVVDYLGAKRPIINFEASSKDSFINFTGRKKFILSIEKDSKLKSVFKDLSEFLSVPVEEYDFDLEPFGLEEISKQYLSSFGNHEM